MIFSNLLVKDTRFSLVLILLEAGLLLKIFLLFLETNKQKDINENLYLLEGQLQTMTEEKDVPYSILKEIQRITGIDFIVYRSITHASFGISGIGSLQPDKNYGEHGDILDYSINWGSPIFVEDFNHMAALSFGKAGFSLVSNEKLTTIYSVPLIYNQKVLGGILFGSRTKYNLTETRKKMFRSITNMLSIYLENKNLYRSVENQATICERQRISREIHDGLAQNIGFINIQLHRLKKMITNQEFEKALQEIDVARDAVQDSYIELREAINQLRDNNGYHHSLEQWIREYLGHFQKVNGIHVETDFCHINKLKMVEEQRLQLTRVVQEIFNNIRKHSHAKNVWLNCQQSEQSIRLTVRDDGVGFDPSINHRRKYQGNGLMILKERIESIHGEILINSSLNIGTMIEIEFPISCK